MKIKFLVLFAAFFLVLTSSCDKNFGQLNQDPGSFTKGQINFDAVFSEIELNTSGNSDGYSYEDERVALGYCSLMIQHLAGQGYPGDKYGYNDEDGSGYWTAQYPNGFKNMADLLANTQTDSSKTNLYNMARIFRVFMYQRMTDIYGDIPYSQAGLGYLSNINFPVFDKQQDIYTDFFKELTDAISKLDASKSNPGAQDIIYGGDITKWKKFAYSEMARLAMRMSKVDPTDAQKYIQQAYTGGAIVTNDDNAIVVHFANVSHNPTNNGLSYTIVTADNGNAMVSQTLVNFMRTHKDPRMRYYATRVPLNSAGTAIPEFGDPAYDPLGDTVATHQIGEPNGVDGPGGVVDVSVVDPNFPGNTLLYSVPARTTFGNCSTPTFFLTATETNLLFAEAVNRGWLTGAGSDASLYQTAVEEEFNRLITVGADWSASFALNAADGYLAANPYNSANGQQLIGEQYWMATFWDEYEAWANWRRTNYPTLVQINYPNTAVNRTGGTIPRRLQYPTTEIVNNNANYAAAVANLPGGDKMTSRMWWDVAATSN